MNDAAQHDQHDTEHGAPANELSEPLRSALATLASRPTVGVGVDFDGTLAPLVDDPMTSRAVDGSVEVLTRLATLPGVAVALISGRDHATLTRLITIPSGVHTVCSHGAEIDGAPTPITEEQRAALDVTEAVLRELLDSSQEGHHGVIETKPTTRVLHVRQLANREEARRLRQAAIDRLSGTPHLHATPGKDIVEFSCVDTTKAAASPLVRRWALDSIGQTIAAEDCPSGENTAGLLYCGDDTTDENLFAVMTSDDVSVRVGDGETRARFRVNDESTVVAALRYFADARAASR